jgi:hypothetical protein
MRRHPPRAPGARPSDPEDVKQSVLAARFAPESCFTRTKSPGAIPSDGAGGGTNTHLDHARFTKIGTSSPEEPTGPARSGRPDGRLRVIRECSCRFPRRSRISLRSSGKGRRNAGRRVLLPSASTDAAARLISVASLRVEGQGGTRSPVGVPPRRLRQRANAAAQLQHALPGTRLLQALAASRLSQSSELLADRSWCRPGVKPEPPESGGDEPPPAGTALAPALGVTRRPSFTERDSRHTVSEIGTNVNENATTFSGAICTTNC